MTKTECLEIVQFLLQMHNSDEFKHIRPKIHKVLMYFNNKYAEL